MKEKTLDKIIIGLAVAIVFMILLFAVGILKEKKNSEEIAGTTNVETTQKTEEGSREQTSGKVTDNESETASGEAKKDEKVTDETYEFFRPDAVHKERMPEGEDVLDRQKRSSLGRTDLRRVRRRNRISFFA